MKPGLQLDQGPPFALPLLFFLAAPLFLALSGIYASLSWAEWTASRWSPSTLALTHLITLGYLAMTMMGALTQMAPVAAGGRLPGVVRAGMTSFALLSPGTALLAWGLGSVESGLLLAGALASSLGLFSLLLSGLAGLANAPRGATRQAMFLALTCLLGVMALGIMLAGWLAGYDMGFELTALVDSHVLFGLAGWVGLLVIGSAYQVVPMLQVTPQYPAWLTRHLAWLLTLFLLTWALATFADWSGLKLASAFCIAAALIAFSLATLDLQRRRRRKLGDTTLHYWRLGMLCLTGASLLALAAHGLPGLDSEALHLFIGILFLLGFAASVVNGMLMKIVPFLAWFHLQAQVGMRQTALGSMKDFLPDQAARLQFRMHLAALALLLPSPWLPGLAIPGGMLLALSALWLEYRLWRAYRVFRAQGGRAGKAA